MEKTRKVTISDGRVIEIKVHVPGMYRLTMPDSIFDGPRFGQFRRQSDRTWLAEVRQSETGKEIRPAGIHDTLADAVDEVVWIGEH